MSRLLAVIVGTSLLQMGAPAQREVVTALSSTLADGYVDEAMGKHLSDVLHVKLDAGGFDRAASPEQFAAAMTDLLQRETKDLHLVLRYIGTSAQGPAAAQPAFTLPPMFTRTEVLAGNVGFMKVRHFMGTNQEIDDAMSKLAGVSALVIDLGDSLGGEPELVQHFSSYLFAQRTHLLNMLARGEAQPMERWTADVPGRRFPNEPVYVLTSARTFSAAESFAFGLQATRRATIVGETTRGGGHFTTFKRLPQGFSLVLPIGRAYDPRTGKGWQGQGVQPDINVPYLNAFEAAIKHLHS